MASWLRLRTKYKKKNTALHKIPNGKNPELDKIQNEQNPEWTKF